ncbi:MAG: GFA family protein [Pseudomonadota bacterium]
MTTLSGHCLCGAIRYAVTPKMEEGELRVDACHCAMCRRQVGGPLMGVTLDGAPVIEDETHLGVFASSEWAERLFCKKCGTNLFYRLRDGSFHTANAGALDGLEDAKFAMQIFVDEKPAYYDFAQDTKKLTGTEVMALFAGEGDPSRD